ncbi:VOC family protein [Fusobacterium hwasookii]|uniref:Lactoylglutathione lyase n=1 Tax=Fusobacterium hwasookii ChDC F128 TaxID=1216362 RepID=A0ABP2R8A6_9FUSO|nr:VOC family protein [Fusobacterium hwasookii]EJU08374.1 lactoylglutathione lyase [Fusobacterium hwasookii ChDC F128]
MKFHHIGICCKNIEKKINSIEKIHKIVKKTKILYDPLQDANLCMLTLEDGTNLELVSGKVVEIFLKKKIDYYHICYEVTDIEDEVEKICSNGGVQISEIKPAVLFSNRRVVFFKVDYGIIELLEEK